MHLLDDSIRRDGKLIIVFKEIQMNYKLKLLLAILFFCGEYAFSQDNQLTEKEKKQGWELLFNGRNLDNWHVYNRDKAMGGWHAADGMIVFHPNGDAVGGADLVSDEEFDDFDLRLEWKISKGGNSGVFFGVQEEAKYPYESYTGIEMQVLDNEEADDRHDPTHLAGALYDLIDASKISKPKPVGQWNAVRISHYKGRIAFWLNGVKTADINKNSPEWKNRVANSKFKDSDFGKFDRGRIALQDHTDEVAFRNIKIRRLK